MLNQVLVPLDGSPLAESSLAVAARIAHASEGTIVLVRVIGVPTTYTPYVYGPDMAQSPSFAQEIMDTEQEIAEKYLAEIVRLDILSGIKVEPIIMQGIAGMAILDTAREEHVEIIVMSSHGETGFKRFVLGSVAQHVSRHSPVPVLVLQGDGSAPASGFEDPKRPLHSITALVALDGSEMSEATLEPASSLVGALAAAGQGTLVLTTIAHKQVNRNKSGTEEQMRDEARKYLIDTVERLQASETAQLHLAIEWSIEEGNDVAEALVQAAESGKVLESSHKFTGCDLIAISTHGRGGLKRWMTGSVTEDVFGKTTLPMLIIGPKGEKS
jgi:nucleotide-binding universal stress UspA family protein